MMPVRGDWCIECAKTIVDSNSLDQSRNTAGDFAPLDCHTSLLLPTAVAADAREAGLDG